MTMTGDGMSQLASDEGSRRFAYTDVTGNITAGIGRNLTGKGLSEAEISILFANDVAECEAALAGYPWFAGLAPVRADVCCNMVFNLGARGFGTYQHMIAALARGDWQGAADQLWDSGAARLLPNRYRRLWWAMVTASWNPSDWMIPPAPGGAARDASNWPVR